MNTFTTWREEIVQAMKPHNESFDDVVCVNCKDLDEKFDSGFGGAEGHPFTLWTQNRVYFPTAYDGAEGVSSAPRNPCDEVMEHV